MSYVYADPSHFGEVFEGAGARMVPVFKETFRRAVRFLRDALKGGADTFTDRAPKCESYEEVTLLDAFRATVARQLTGYVVESTEMEVEGSRGGCYRRAYHCAQYRDGEDANGEGSLRCCTTKVMVRAQQTG